MSKEITTEVITILRSDQPMRLDLYQNLQSIRINTLELKKKKLIGKMIKYYELQKENFDYIQSVATKDNIFQDKLAYEAQQMTKTYEAILKIAQ